MITLTGTLRQFGEVTIKEKKLLKIWVEHETARDNGAPDLKIEEMFLGAENCARMPAKGSLVAIEVRPYPRGHGVAFQAISIAAANVTA